MTALDELHRLRSIVDVLKAQTAPSPVDDFVLEVALPPWGAIDVTPDPDPEDPVPLARWLFDAPGDQTDATGNGHTLTFTAGTGTSDLAYPLTSMSIMWWTIAGSADSGLGDGSTATGVGGGGFNVRAVYDSAGDPWGVISVPWFISLAFPAGWVHWCVTWNPGAPDPWTLYVNGSQVTVSPSLINPGASTVAVFGEHGSIADVQVWSGVFDEDALAPIVAAGP